MKTLIIAIAAAAAIATPAYAASYEQGICNGLRASGAYAADVNIGIIAEGRAQRYFRCNGTTPAAPTGPTVTIQPDGGLGHH